MLGFLAKALSGAGKAIGGVGKEIYKKKRKGFLDSLNKNGNGNLGERRRKERERRQMMDY